MQTLTRRIDPVNKVLNKVISKKALLEMIPRCQDSCETREIRIRMKLLLTILAVKHHLLAHLITTVLMKLAVRPHEMIPLTTTVQTKRPMEVPALTLMWQV